MVSHKLILKSFTYADSCSAGINEGITIDSCNCNWKGNTFSKTKGNDFYKLLFVTCFQFYWQNTPLAGSISLVMEGGS